jgi:hypothetical protein
MTPPQPRRGNTSLSCYLLLAVALALFSAATGCKSGAAPHTSDPKLTGIDELLAAQLPPGTPRSRVVFFLNSRGYAMGPSPDSQSIVATVHHINTSTLQPEAARITFHFDANDKLTTYDLEPASTLPTT